MEKLLDIYNYTKLGLVVELILLGSLEEFHLPTVIVLGVLMIITCGALMFFRKAIKICSEKMATNKRAYAAKIEKAA